MIAPNEGTGPLLTGQVVITVPTARSGVTKFGGSQGRDRVLAEQIGAPDVAAQHID
jgi:hypothetical protein